MKASKSPGRLIALPILLLLFLAATLIPVLIGFDHNRQARIIDHYSYHIPTVMEFAAALPAVDLSDYRSATTPGTHLLLALVVRAFGPSETMLQVCSCFFGVAFLIVAYINAARVASPWTALACVLPLASSPYVLSNAIWVMTDNLSFTLIAITLGSTLFCVAGIPQATRSGLALVCSVFVRQINIWVSGVALLGFLFQWEPVRRRLPFADPLQPSHRGLGPAMIFAVATIAAVAIIASFVSLWGGLVPPKFQVGGNGGATHAGDLNFGLTPGVLSVLAVYASPAILVLLPCWLHNRRVRRTALIGLLLGLLAGLLFESVTGWEHGRSVGWVWGIAGRSPTFFDRNSLIVAGSTVGGCCAGILFGILVAADRARTAWLMAGFTVSFLSAYTVNSHAFQRYFDPLILLAIGWCLASLESRQTELGTIGKKRLRIAATAVFAMQAAHAAFSLYARMQWSMN